MILDIFGEIALVFIDVQSYCIPPQLASVPVSPLDTSSVGNLSESSFDIIVPLLCSSIPQMSEILLQVLFFSRSHTLHCLAQGIRLRTMISTAGKFPEEWEIKFYSAT